MPSIVCIAGNRRPGNFTAKCLDLVADSVVGAGSRAEIFDGSAMHLSFPDQDKTPDGVALEVAVRAADAVILATPEYHGTFAAYTKLMIENLGYPSALQGKPVGLLGVAGGRIGAIKAIEHLRSCMAHLGAVVVPGAISIPNVRKMFDAQGQCHDADTQLALARLADRTIAFLQHYNPQDLP